MRSWSGRKAAVPGGRLLLPQQAGRSIPCPVIKALQREFQSELVNASVLKLNIDGGDAQRHRGVPRPLRRRSQDERRHAAAARPVRRHHPARRSRGHRHPHPFLRRPGDPPVARRLRGRDQGQPAARSPARHRPPHPGRSGGRAALRQARRHRAILSAVGRSRSTLADRHAGASRGRPRRQRVSNRVDPPPWRRAVVRRRLARRELLQHLQTARRDRDRHDPARTRQAAWSRNCRRSTRSSRSTPP